jgi:hypothetical protein
MYQHPTSPISGSPEQNGYFVGQMARKLNRWKEDFEELELLVCLLEKAYSLI